MDLLVVVQALACPYVIEQAEACTTKVTTSYALQAVFPKLFHRQAPPPALLSRPIHLLLAPSMQRHSKSPRHLHPSPNSPSKPPPPARAMHILPACESSHPISRPPWAIRSAPSWQNAAPSLYKPRSPWEVSWHIFEPPPTSAPPLPIS